MKTFIGVKMIQAEPAERDGEAGYRVIYSDGYESWSPKEVFERGYFEIERPDRLGIGDVNAFISEATLKKVGEKTCLVVATLRNGFELMGASACVSPENYNDSIGYECCMKHIRDDIYKCLGFVLQWANRGLKDD